MKKSVKTGLIITISIVICSISYIEFSGIDVTGLMDFVFTTDSHDYDDMDGGEGLVGAEIPDAKELDPEALKQKLLTKRDDLDYQLIKSELRLVETRDVSTEDLNRVVLEIYVPPEVTGDIGIADAIEFSKPYIESVIESGRLTNGLAMEFYNDLETISDNDKVPVVVTNWAINGDFEKNHFVGDYSEHRIVATEYNGEELTGDMMLSEKFTHSTKDTNGKAEEIAKMAVSVYGSDMKYVNYNVDENSVFMTIKAETDTGNATGYRNSMYSRTSQFLEDIKKTSFADVNIMWYTEIQREDEVEEAQIAYMAFTREKIDEFDFTPYFSVDGEAIDKEIERFSVQEFANTTDAYREELAINPNNH